MGWAGGSREGGFDSSVCADPPRIVCHGITDPSAGVSVPAAPNTDRTNSDVDHGAGFADALHSDAHANADQQPYHDPLAHIHTHPDPASPTPTWCVSSARRAHSRRFEVKGEQYHDAIPPCVGWQSSAVS